MKLPVAPEGIPFILAAWAIAAALGVLAPWPVWAAWLLVAIWVVAFFRNPERTGPRGDQFIIAPADGKVVAIVRMEEPAFLRGPSQRVSIFMNVFNVHVNRYPCQGTITYLHYLAGKFLNAAADKASLENEQSSVGLETKRGRVLIRQIAGLIARRIVTDGRDGAIVEQGARMGLIRFGSRVDIFLPPEVTVAVKEGDMTHAGETVVARWN